MNRRGIFKALVAIPLLPAAVLAAKTVPPARLRVAEGFLSEFTVPGGIHYEALEPLGELIPFNGTFDDGMPYMGAGKLMEFDPPRVFMTDRHIERFSITTIGDASEWYGGA